MNKIDKLIAEFCPDGVEWKTLGECVEKNIGGGTPSKSIKSYWNGEIPWASVGDLTPNGNYISSTRNHITKEGLKNSSSNVILKGNVIVAVKISPGKMKIADIDVAINQDLRGLLLKGFLNNKFLTYFFQTISISGNGTIVKGITVDTLNKIPIPIPPLAIQQEIVNILDKFTLLEAELKAELKARRTQYEYYRNELLNFEGKEVEWKWETINNICSKITSGGTPLTSKLDYYNGDIPWLRTQEVDWNDIEDVAVKITDKGLENSSAKWIPTNCVIVAMYGATAAKVAVNKIPLTTNQACCNLEVNEACAKYRYVFHWLCKEYVNLRALGEGTQANINGNKIKNYKIPIPSLAEQERIVAILDNFDKLVNDISEGLPAEIAARQKQYEYYRGKLLNFKELSHG